MKNNGTGDEKRILKFVVNYAQYGLIGAVIIVYSILSPVFISPSNIRELLAISSPLLVCSVGMTFVLLIAEIDLSVGSIAGVSGALWVVCVVNYGMPVAAGAVIGVLGGMVMGAANALFIVKLKINSFLVTLGTQVFGRGLVFFIASGEQILTTDEMKRLTYQDVFGISVLALLSVGITIVMALFYKYSSFGRRLQAVGCDRTAAAKIGIDVNRVRFSVFVLAGFFAGIAGLMQVGNIGMLNPVYVGNNMEFLAITAVVLGGTSLFGGTGTIVPGTLVGVIFTMSIENGLGILGANPYIYPVVRGSVIYLAMFTDSLKRSIGIGMDK
ncbi:MAG: ABC transporter permease [Synergistaceae bacterium]|jgi:ribose transport system permease protein|nr:ABC transporter permease [Synergistaceae bacterium]